MFTVYFTNIYHYATYCAIQFLRLPLQSAYIGTLFAAHGCATADRSRTR
jgi:hypothetical protein